MSGEPFTLDTNILVYSVDRNAEPRHRQAAEIVDRASISACVLTLQAISEFYAVVTRKGLAARPDAAQIGHRLLQLFATAAPSAAAVRGALDAASAGRAHYWDALLVLTAAEAGCTAILTEDLTPGTTLFGVRIINPFTQTGLAPEADTLLNRD